MHDRLNEGLDELRTNIDQQLKGLEDRLIDRIEEVIDGSLGLY